MSQIVSLFELATLLYILTCSSIGSYVHNGNVISSYGFFFYFLLFAAKSLVFSQYTSTLKWLQLNLAKHGFHYRSLSGDMSMNQRAKALRDFQQDPPTTIFLLSMR
jgi:SNF2 family DNA or RNA helicase